MSTHPALTPARQAGTHVTYPWRIEGWVELVVDYILRWFTCLQTATHPSSNQARHILTTTANYQWQYTNVTLSMWEKLLILIVKRRVVVIILIVIRTVCEWLCGVVQCSVNSNMNTCNTLYQQLNLRWCWSFAFVTFTYNWLISWYWCAGPDLAGAGLGPSHRRTGEGRCPPPPHKKSRKIFFGQT